MKTILKILLISLIHLIVISVVNGMLPYSGNYKDLLMSSPQAFSSLLTVWLIGLWNAVLIFLGARYSGFQRLKTWLLLSAYLFLLQPFMTQTETWFFSGSFEVLKKTDILLIMAGQLVAILLSVLSGVYLFKPVSKKNDVQGSISHLIPKLLLIGLLYMIIYMLFGYFVAWQFEALRIFYSGSPIKASFLQVMLDNIHNTPWIFPFQIMRGLFFGLINYLLYKILVPNTRIYVIGTLISNISLGLMLLIPNPLFPDTVRIAHFYEVTSSMILFSMLMCMIFLRKSKI